MTTLTTRTAPRVELVEVRTEDGVPLDGALVPAAAGVAPIGGFDAALTVHGVGGAFYEPFFKNFAAALAASGIAVVRANNRGHNIVNKGDRKGRYAGAALEDITESRLDIRAWLAWLEERGHRNVLLFGHSLGAVKTALYLAHESDARVRAGILASPPRFNTDLMRSGPRGPEFVAALTAAQALVDAGRGDEFVQVTFPTPSYFGARSFIAKYGAGDRHDVFALVKSIRVPVLALTGERELADVSFADHPTGFSTAASGKADLTYVVVPDGDHYYTNQQAFVTERLLAWINGPDEDDGA
jgi:pimeloyl-ACP methyl ester carboxylesterase